nr:SUN domain-containing protein 2-like [Onthophagus taurus]
MEFIKDQEMPRSSVCNVSDDGTNSRHNDDNNNANNQNKEQNLQTDREDEAHSTDDGFRFTPSVMTSTASRTPRERVARRVEKADEVLDIVAKKLSESPAKSQYFDNFGKHVAEQLRRLPKEQAIYLTKIINDGIFEAQCGALSKRPHIVIPPEVPIIEQHYVQEYPRQVDTSVTDNHECQAEPDGVAHYLNFNP